MEQNLYTQIKSNKRKTFLILIAFVALFVSATWAISFAMGYKNKRLIENMIVVTICCIIYLLITCCTPLAASLAPLSVGAKRIDNKDKNEHSEKVLINVVEELAIAANVKCPSIYIQDNTNEMNAFASGTNKNKASITVTLPLLNILNRDELTAVIGHEMSHIRNLDIRIQTIANSIYDILMWITYILGEIAEYAFLFMGSNDDNDSDDGNDDNSVIAQLLVALIGNTILPIAAIGLKLALSRNREYLADAGSVELTHNPQALTSALLKIDNSAKEEAEKEDKLNISIGMLGINGDLKKTHWYDEFLNTHPSTENRINRLQHM